MKKILFCFLCIIISTSAFCIDCIGTTTAENLKIRKEPGLNTEILGEIPLGTNIKILSRSNIQIEYYGNTGYWFYIENDNLPSGWAWGYFINYNKTLIDQIPISYSIEIINDNMETDSNNSNVNQRYQKIEENNESGLQIYQLPIIEETIEVRKINDSKINEIIQGSDFTVFQGERQIWIMKNDQFRAFTDLYELPKEINWFQKVILKDDILYISVGDFPNERQVKESNTGLGGFRAGPTSKGMIVYNYANKEYKYIPSFKIEENDLNEFQQLNSIIPTHDFPSEIKPSIQSYSWNEEKLFVGVHGYLLELDFTNETAKIIEMDYGPSINRVSMVKKDQTIWIAEDEGGVSGGWVKLIEDNNEETFRFPGFHRSSPTGLIAENDYLFASSTIGLVKIEYNDYSLNYFRISDVDEENYIYDLKKIDDLLCAESDNGIIIFSSDLKSATRLSIQGDNVTNVIYSFEKINGKWYFGDKNGLYVEK